MTRVRLDRAEFAERLRVQFQARYGGVVSVDPQALALRVQGQGIDETVSLTPLLHACEREPGNSAELIAAFVRRVETQMTPRTGTELHLGRLLWCVRSDRYLAGLARSDELLRRDIGGGLTAFVAESLPDSAMRGVAATEWQQRGIADSEVVDVADKNTRERFIRLVPRIRDAGRIPADGWRLSGDVLYQGSVLLVPEILEALAARAGGEVLLGNPDRSVVLALPADLPAARSFAMRVVREWREAMNPASREVLVTDGVSLRPVARKGGALLPWLND